MALYPVDSHELGANRFEPLGFQGVIRDTDMKKSIFGTFSSYCQRETVSLKLFLSWSSCFLRNRRLTAGTFWMKRSPFI